jgi:hypothetical protein
MQFLMKTTAIMAIVLIVAAVGIVTSTIAVNSAFAGVPIGFTNPGQCHRSEAGHGKAEAEFCKQFKP